MVVTILLACVAHAYAKDFTEEFVDKLVDKFVDKLFAHQAPTVSSFAFTSARLPPFRPTHLSHPWANPSSSLRPLPDANSRSIAMSASRGFSPLMTSRNNQPTVRIDLPEDESELAEGILQTKEGPLTKLTLTSASGSSAEIFTLGATVTSFKPQGASEVLFVRPDAKFDGSKPISGGLPFCWPQFGPGDIQQHGFARNCDWALSDLGGGPNPSVTFLLKPSEDTKKMWDHDFKNSYTVTVGDDGKLKTTFTVMNTGSEPFTFTGALHSYFGVGDIDQTAVQGAFKGASIFDRMLNPPARSTEDRAEVTVAAETDRCYEGVNGVVKIADKANGRTIVIDNKAGYADTCVWNPWNEGMGSKKFICVESGNVKDAVTVAPGTTWTGEMTLSLE